MDTICAEIAYHILSYVDLKGFFTLRATSRVFWVSTPEELRKATIFRNLLVCGDTSSMCMGVNLSLDYNDKRTLRLFVEEWLVRGIRHSIEYISYSNTLTDCLLRTIRRTFISSIDSADMYIAKGMIKLFSMGKHERTDLYYLIHHSLDNIQLLVYIADNIPTSRASIIYWLVYGGTLDMLKMFTMLIQPYKLDCISYTDIYRACQLRCIREKDIESERISDYIYDTYRC